MGRGGLPGDRRSPSEHNHVVPFKYNYGIPGCERWTGLDCDPHHPTIGVVIERATVGRPDRCRAPAGACAVHCWCVALSLCASEDLHPERRSDPECVVSASFATGCVPSPTVNGASTRPWTGMYTFVKDDTQYELVEYACHEGNYGMFNILTGSRAKEREADSQR
jgi:hypothetical protein